MKLLSLRSMRFLEKQLRYPLLMAFFALYLLASYAFLETEKIYLPTEQTPVTFYCNQTGDDLTKTLKEAIAQAKKSITVFIYSFTDQQLIEALRRKAEEGVKVDVIQDALATTGTELRLGPKVTVYRRKDKGLMHDKILIIDNSQVWFGSTNFTRDSLLLHANILIGIQSPDLANSCQDKANACIQKTKWKSPAILIQSNIHDEKKEQIDKGNTIHFFFLPDSPQALEKLITTIDTAQKTIKVAMYTFTHPRIVQALVNASRRGIDVEIVMDYESAKQTSSKAFQRFKREKMNVAVSNRKGLLHYKLAIIDDEMLVAGSANWTKAAFTINDDAIAFIYPLTTEQKTKLTAMWQKIKQESKSSFSS